MKYAWLNDSQLKYLFRNKMTYLSIGMKITEHECNLKERKKFYVLKFLWRVSKLKERKFQNYDFDFKNVYI
jgi:hypothetical protein